MIKDNIKFADLYYGMHKDFEKVFDVLKNLDENIPAGKIEINENVWININNAPTEQGDCFIFEAHRDFIDIHYITEGEEEFVCAPCDGLELTKEYDKKEDYLLMRGNGDTIILKKGDFVIVYPQDAHAPMVKIKDKNHCRTVAKIRI